MFTVLEPQDDEKLTLPPLLFTVTLNVAELLPVTFFEAGVTCICPLLLEVAVIVPLPKNWFRYTVTVAAPLLRIVSCSGLVESEHDPGVGVGLGVGLVVGLGEATGVGVGVGFCRQLVPLFPQGVAVGDGDACGVGEADGSGVGETVGDGEESGVGVGSGITGPPGPLSVTGGIEAS